MKKSAKNEFLRKLPQVDEVLRIFFENGHTTNTSRTTALRAIQELIRERREELMSAADPSLFGAAFYEITGADITEKCRALNAPTLMPVLNASGIIVHTNLGRAPLSREALREVQSVACCYSNLEFNLAAGQRGSRAEHIEELLVQLTGAEAAFAVNNNAAAVLLSLAALARGADVLVSRGELVEIGGSFRIPDVMEQSGARLVEVGTTNRTHVSDYRSAITGETGLLFKAHPSNYRILGFTADVGLAELVRLGSEHALPVLFDLGSGCVVDTALTGLTDEITVQQAVKTGADIVTFSGDKLFGGPQAGIIVGKKAFVDRIRRHPLARALRIDKLTLAALSATLRTYVLEPENIASIPVLAMLTASQEDLRIRARAVAESVKQVLPAGAVTAEQDFSQVGGGSCPLEELPTWVVSIDPRPMLPNRCDGLLRAGAPPVVCRISKDRVLFDMRTILPHEDDLLSACLQAVFRAKTIS
jgi:L-seryl-tRNA(Ser) seleniumtransferase